MLCALLSYAAMLALFPSCELKPSGNTAHEDLPFNASPLLAISHWACNLAPLHSDLLSPMQEDPKLHHLLRLEQLHPQQGGSWLYYSLHRDHFLHVRSQLHHSIVAQSAASSPCCPCNSGVHYVNEENN